MTPQAAVIESFTLGPYETNCYLVRVPGAPGCWIVDAGFGPAALISRIKSLSLTPTALVLTHAHLDHIAGIAEVRRAFPALPIWIHEAEAAWLSDSELNLSAFSEVPVTAPGPDRTLVDGERLTLEGSTWEVRHTPGHSPGGITLYNSREGVALVGDALFAGSIGRTDFPGCSFENSSSQSRPSCTRCPMKHASSAGTDRRRALVAKKRPTPTSDPDSTRKATSPPAGQSNAARR